MFRYIDFEILNDTEILFEIIDINNTLDCYEDITGFVELHIQNGTEPYLFDSS